VIGDDGDVIVCVDEENVYDFVGDWMGSGNDGVGSSWVLDSRSAFYVCPWRDLFDSFRNMSGGTVTLADGLTLSVVGVSAVRFQMWDGMIRMVIDIRYVPGIWRSFVSLGELDSRGSELRIGGTVTLADGSTLSVVGVSAVRFQMWDGMIRTVIDIRYVPSIWRSLVSLSELDSRGSELRIGGGSMEVLHGDMIVIRETRCGGLHEMVGTVESASTVISASDTRRGRTLPLKL
jgi:hypothetical protein